MSTEGARWREFDAADHLASRAWLDDTPWERVKDRGNETLKRAFDGNGYAAAAELYESAAKLALGPLRGGMIEAFLSSLEAWPEGSAQRRFAENRDIVWDKVVVQLHHPPKPRRVDLPGGKVWEEEYPNKGAAIAWANCAQAHLKNAGVMEFMLQEAAKSTNSAAICATRLMLDEKREVMLQEALKAAQRAIDANPAYLKAHHRKLSALKKLGKAVAARELAKKMKDYDLARTMYPCEALALLAAGWISWQRSSLIYGPVRFKAIAEAVAESLPEGMRRVEARASLVPFQGGQALMMTLA